MPWWRGGVRPTASPFRTGNSVPWPAPHAIPAAIRMPGRGRSISVARPVANTAKKGIANACGPTRSGSRRPTRRTTIVIVAYAAKNGAARSIPRSRVKGAT